MRAFLDQRLFGPAGMPDADPRFDEVGTFAGSSYVHAPARQFARFGELYLHDGVVGDERVLPEGWVDHARTVVAVDPETGIGYGRHWWIWPRSAGLAGRPRVRGPVRRRAPRARRRASSTSARPTPPSATASSPASAASSPPSDPVPSRSPPVCTGGRRDGAANLPRPVPDRLAKWGWCRRNRGPCRRRPPSRRASCRRSSATRRGRSPSPGSARSGSRSRSSPSRRSSTSSSCRSSPASAARRPRSPRSSRCSSSPACCCRSRRGSPTRC